MLSKKEQEEIIIKIGIDPFEFLKYVKIQEPGELALSYESWPHLVEFYQSLERYKLISLLKSKQIGVSWALAIRVLRRLYTTPGANILELSSGEKEAQKLLNKSKIVYHNLPEWMQIYTLEPNSTEQFGFKEMRSLVVALPSTEKAGIGETSDWVIHDEADFHEYFETNLGHTMATVADNPSRKLTVVSTTDKTKPDSPFKQLHKAARSGSNNFHAMFFPYDARPGRDEEFLEDQKRQNESTPWVVEANYPISEEEALSPQSAQSCFKKEVLDRLWDNATKNSETRQGFIHILCPPRVGIPYAAGVDVGEGVGLDYSVLTIVGKEGLSSEVVALIYTNELATDLFAYECDKLCREYFNLLLAVENNAIGVAVMNKLVELGYPNLYYSDDKRQKAGWTTGEKNKYTATVELVQVINNGSLITKFRPQIKEMMEYQWVNGKPVPTGKTHGDTVISLMLANQMLKRVGIRQKATLFVGGRRIF